MRGKPHPLILALQAERRLQGISREHLARVTGYTPSHLYAVETGHQGCRIEIAQDIAKALGMELKLMETSVSAKLEKRGD